ncbi:hypothetical protein C7M61_004998 [Candidozyma pseudohaemuli]|uniref:RRM domain-containing protein n=1 Tax=Candidozyma pseudohaemuli TaxID=418784 RepID=A0A2P7YFB0_9ASCO|nr:hypothetical protein C7M61_004998 [[Candida] pseudohaemulonii]PSK34638.1 hypothetical protein C7M61_004998 [[Candida] pseudohaemulonii]
MNRRAGSPPQGNPGQLSILYLGSIPFEWSEDQLQAVVTSQASVLDVRLGFDHIGKNKGYAFVEFESPQEAQKAVAALSQAKINVPDGRPARRLRFELSKEGFRTGNNTNKQPLPYIPQNMPPYFELPGGLPARPASGLPPVPGMPQRPNAHQPSPGPQLPPVPGSNGPKFANMANQNGAQLPDHLLRASQTLSTPAQIPLETPDKINETLSLIPPAQLIELIANLKTLLAGNNSARAAEVFNLSPNLAAAAAQALLLMGFVDEEVIQESMKSASSTPQPQQSAPAYNQQQQYQQGYGQPPQGYNSGGYNQPLASLPPPPPRPQSQFPQQQQQPPTKWGNLPLSTQMKLGALPPDQADLVAQVLSLPPDQISSLPPEKQTMVAGIRQQYL